MTAHFRPLGPSGDVDVPRVTLPVVAMSTKAAGPDSEFRKDGSRKRRDNLLGRNRIFVCEPFPNEIGWRGLQGIMRLLLQSS